MVLTLVPFRCGGICHCRLNINNNNRAKGFTSYIFGRYDGIVYIYKGEVTRKDHSGEYKMLSENDYKKIFENVVPTEIPEINRELIDIYLYNTRWIKIY